MPTRDARILNLFQQGMHLPKIAAKYGISRQRVWQIICEQAEKESIPLRPRIYVGTCEPRIHVPTSLLKKCQRREMTVRELAQRMFCSEHTIYKRLEALGGRQPSGESQGLMFYRLYRTTEKLLRELADEFGVALATVNSHICTQRRKERAQGIRPYYRLHRRS